MGEVLKVTQLRRDLRPGKKEVSSGDRDRGEETQE